jgi:hypothetical protein
MFSIPIEFFVYLICVLKWDRINEKTEFNVTEIFSLCD